MKQLFRQDSKEIIVLSLFYILMGVAFMVLNVHILSTAVLRRTLPRRSTSTETP